MCAAQVLKLPDCQLLEHFLRAHVFARNMIQYSYDLQAGLITDFLRIANHAGTPPHDLRCHIASRLQLCLADEKSLLAVNSDLSPRQDAR